MPKAPGVALLCAIEPSDLMHPTRRKRPFSDPEWIFECKYEGYRCLIRKRGKRVDLLTHDGDCLTPDFPDILNAVNSVPGDFVWDGALTVDDTRGVPSLRLLQIRVRAPTDVHNAVRPNPARLYLFDMLATRKRDLRELPLIDRKRYLRDAFDDTDRLLFSKGIVGAGEWVFEQAKHYGFGGMVGKRLISPYRRGRSRDWVKIGDSG